MTSKLLYLQQNFIISDEFSLKFIQLARKLRSFFLCKFFSSSKITKKNAQNILIYPNTALRLLLRHPSQCCHSGALLRHPVAAPGCGIRAALPVLKKKVLYIQISGVVLKYNWKIAHFLKGRNI